MSDSSDAVSTRLAALSIFKAGIAAADPYQAVIRFIQVDSNRLTIQLNDPHRQRNGHWRKIHIMAFGKAACAMMKAAIKQIPPNLRGQALAVTNYDNVSPIDSVIVMGASHPLPDENGFSAAKRCAELAHGAKENELVLVLISGGGSALIPYPADGITLQEKITTTNLLLSCGANINQINCVRKHISELKGGGLARLVAPADFHALILSDVLGDDISAIASGPTVPDQTTFAEAIAILQEKQIWDKSPESVRQHLIKGQNGDIPETPKTDDAIFDNTAYTLIGSNTISLKAVENKARESGYQTLVYSEHLSGEAREAAEHLVKYARRLQTEGLSNPIAILAGGETTVTLKGNGRGGRNQEFAVAFALAAEQYHLTDHWVLLSGGTDGRDGPTDAAGGLIDHQSLARMQASPVNPGSALENNDAYHALSSSQDLLITGPTGTNVADLVILLIHPVF